MVSDNKTIDALTFAEMTYGKGHNEAVGYLNRLYNTLDTSRMFLLTFGLTAFIEHFRIGIYHQNNGARAYYGLAAMLFSLGFILCNDEKNKVSAIIQKMESPVSNYKANPA